MQPNINEGRFWVVHFSIFFLCMSGGVILQWVGGAWLTDSWIGTLADVTGASFGCAFTVASIVAVSMVIYNRFFKPVWEEQRREEGRREGRKEVREETRAWWERKLAAEAKGESFDEPPPFLEDAEETTSAEEK